ncbi:MAG: hypothetical protein NTV32_10270 [Gammaproteobacteria bacterium]|nr:hypothetical protein [Gammaproteobacteria bacterium]
MMHYVKCVVAFNTEFGPDAEEFYTKPEALFDKALACAEENQILDVYQTLAYKIVDMATDGWGHKDTLSDTYAEYYHEPFVS